MSHKVVINLSRDPRGKILKTVNRVSLTNEEEAIFAARAANHAASRKEERDAVLGMNEEQKKRYHIKNRLIKGFQSKDPAVLERVFVYMEKIRRFYNNDNLRIKDLNSEQRDRLIEAMVDDEYDARF